MADTRNDHRTGDTTWNNPRVREKNRRTEETAKRGVATGHDHNDEPWPTELPKSGGLDPRNPLGR